MDIKTNSEYSSKNICRILVEAQVLSPFRAEELLTKEKKNHTGSEKKQVQAHGAA